VGDKHVVRFEPVGIEIEVDEDQTILRAAAEQGVQLMHGCKEGQCAACKSFVLEGEDIELDRYSTFALPDYELEEGWTLLCRAHAVEDLEVELINYDEEILTSGVALRTARARVEAIEPLTRDIRRLVLSVVDGEMPFRSGQYVDIGIPGTDDSRSFSMANLPSDDGRLEFMIKLYPGGVFSSLLADGVIQVGDELDVTGPYGVFTLRDTERPILFIGGGAGMAPILSLLRFMVEQGVERPAVYYYGAREEEDLFHLEELQALAAALPGSRFVPALSHAEWDGENGLITDVVDRLEADLADVDAYLCGPPPMVDAAVELLQRRGAPEAQVHFDKFTTTAETEESTRT
jgi:propane monooxygenase reductase subunit